MSFHNAPVIPAKRRYKKLFQDDCLAYSTEEEEEVVLYEKKGLAGNDDRGHITYSLSDLDLPKQPSSTSSWSDSIISFCRRIRCLSVSLTLFFIVLIIFAIAAGIYLIFLPQRSVNDNSILNDSVQFNETSLDSEPPYTKVLDPPTPTPTPVVVSPMPAADPVEVINFTVSIPHKMTLTSPEFMDVNDDGNLDIVIASTVGEADEMYSWYCVNQDKIKEDEEVCTTASGSYRCGSLVVALSGMDGSALWQYKAPLPIFAITCSNDLSGDGTPDCMLCGRMGYWHAVNGKTGEYIWDVDHTLLNAHHNFFYPLPIGDLNDDGIVDFVNMHSGDPRYAAIEHERPAGRFIVVSGRTGQKLMDPFLTPNMKESYMNPVRYTTEDNDFILFGSGGETVEGGLWAVTVKSLKERVDTYISNQTWHTYENGPTNNPHCKEFFDEDPNKPQFTVDYSQYNISDDLDKEVLDLFYEICPKTIFHPVPNKHKMCIYRVTFSPEKGVILPPVMIDMNGDNIDDLVISLYAGHTMVMDGSTGGIIWDRYIPGTESYSIPAPLYFNEDKVPDLFVRVNKGTWDSGYNYSYVGVVDGRNGELLWVHNSSEVGFMSGTTLRAKEHGQDAVLFMTVGELPTQPLEEVKALEVITMGNMTPHQYRKKRNVSPNKQQSFSPTEELDNLLGFSRQLRSTQLSNLNDSGQGVGAPFDSSSRAPMPNSLSQKQQVNPTPTSSEPWVEEHSSSRTTSSAVTAPKSSPSVINRTVNNNESFSIFGFSNRYQLLYERELLNFWEDWSDIYRNSPKTEPEKFIHDDCGVAKMPISIFFLTRDLIARSQTKQPILTQKEKIVFPIIEGADSFTYRLRRHGDHSAGDQLDVQDSLTLYDLRHDWGCFNVFRAGVIVGTPAMVDINNDGEIELVYLISWDHSSTESFSRSTDQSPAQVFLQVVTLKEATEQSIPEAAKVVDFTSFLPYSQQPWTKYMGKNRDSVYLDNYSTFSSEN